MGEINSVDLNIHYCGQEYLRKNGELFIVNQRLQNAILGCILESNRMIPRQTIQYHSIQVYGSTTNGKEADVEQFYDELQGLQELTPKKKKKSFSS